MLINQEYRKALQHIKKKFGIKEQLKKYDEELQEFNEAYRHYIFYEKYIQKYDVVPGAIEKKFKKIVDHLIEEMIDVFIVSLQVKKTNDFFEHVANKVIETNIKIAIEDIEKVFAYKIMRTLERIKNDYY